MGWVSTEPKILQLKNIYMSMCVCMFVWVCLMLGSLKYVQSIVYSTKDFQELEVDTCSR